MAMANNKTTCFTCNTEKITYSCEGCSKRFCLMHLIEHQQILNDELNHITNEYNEFKQTINEQKQNSQIDLLVKQIDQWETNSIEIIQQKAQECRKTAMEYLPTFFSDIEMKFNNLNEQIKEIHQENECNEINLNYLRNELIEITQELNNPPNISIKEDSQSFINEISIISSKISRFSKWKQNAVTVAGGNGQEQKSNELDYPNTILAYQYRHLLTSDYWQDRTVEWGRNAKQGQELNQLNRPGGIFIDKNKNILIADSLNHRIVKWKYNAKKGQIIAGGNGQGNRIGQLNCPVDVIVNQQNQSIIIADGKNRRVIQWLNQKEQILIENIHCSGLAMDKSGFLYVSDSWNNEVRRWKIGEYNNEGIVVAGGYDQRNQLNYPTFMFVDEDQSVYVSDRNNHRVIKWRKDAKAGTIVAGGNGQGRNLNQLSCPQGIVIDHLGQIYVADSNNNRVMCWCEGKEEGKVIVGGNDGGSESNQLNSPMGLAFDDEENLYVVDSDNHRIQKFEIIL
ncbi:unnamed protein product [Adineta steineri]|uniref:Uncharacterized protein n=1 Tax=Adineta steineri TaxID=433720 RepID=A0A819M384_9BILA|nr:unnamed protein product [Adineta steineri]CAF3973008.1 unnamed protein product [Adineta steineri]CAF4008486.1 unnamed protein product [Adineta steineri]